MKELTTPELRVADRIIARFTHIGGRVIAARRLPKLHARIYSASHGRVARRWFGSPVLVLETAGRRTGQRHRTPLVFARRGNDIVVVAANAGSAREPAWSLNLAACPNGKVVLSGREVEVAARTATAEERDRLWQELVRRYPPLPAYLEFTAREFPIWILSPREHDWALQ